MGQFSVTQRQWQEVMGNNPSYFKDAGSDAPVEQVDWNQAQAFLAKANTVQSMVCPIAYGGRMGIRSQSRNHRRNIQAARSDRLVPRERFAHDSPCGDEITKRFRSLRHARKRMAMLSGLVRSV